MMERRWNHLRSRPPSHPDGAQPAARGVFEVGLDPVFVKFRLQQADKAAEPSKPDKSKSDKKSSRTEKPCSEERLQKLMCC